MVGTKPPALADGLVPTFIDAQVNLRYWKLA